MCRRPRVLFVVQPALFETALVDILRRANIDDVVSAAELDGDIRGSYDIAVVTGDVPDGVTSEVTIQLPQNESGTGDITVRDHSGSRTSRLISLRQVFDALDRASPASLRRADLI